MLYFLQIIAMPNREAYLLDVSLHTFEHFLATRVAVQAVDSIFILFDFFKNEADCILDFYCLGANQNILVVNSAFEFFVILNDWKLHVRMGDGEGREKWVFGLHLRYYYDTI